MLLLVEVIFAVFVCALAVHAAAVRLMFAMARDNNLPFADALSHVSPRSRRRSSRRWWSASLAGAILVVNVKPSQRDRDALFDCHRLGQPCIPDGDVPTLAVAATIARAAPAASPASREVSRNGAAAPRPRRHFSLGRFGLPVNVVAGRLGPLRRHQHQLAAHRDLRRPSLGPVRRAAGNPLR